MVRRRKESDLDFFLTAPWQASAVVAVAGFVAFEWVIPAVTASSPILKMLGATFKPAGYIIGAIFGLIAVVNFFRQRPASGGARSGAARKYVPSPIPPGAPTTDQVTKTWEDMMARAPRPELKPESKPQSMVAPTLATN